MRPHFSRVDVDIGIIFKRERGRETKTQLNNSKKMTISMDEKMNVDAEHLVDFSLHGNCGEEGVVEPWSIGPVYRTYILDRSYPLVWIIDIYL